MEGQGRTKCFVLFLLLTALFVNGSSYAQKIRIRASNKDFDQVRIVSKFDCVNDDMDTSKYIWVADLSVEFDTVLPGTLEGIYREFWTRANHVGANAFKVKDSDLYTVGEKRFITLSVYWLRMEYRDENMTLFNSPDVYYFGLLGHHVDLDGYDVSFNGQDLLLRELTYHHFSAEDNEKVEVSIGGRSRGDITTFIAEAKTLPRYFYFKQATGSFKNAWVYEYDWNMGEFLVSILEKN